MRVLGPSLAAVSCSVLILLSATAQASPRKAKTHSSGLALGAVLPIGAGLLGLRADYTYQLPESNWRLAAHAGAGGPICAEPDCHLSMAFGVTGTWGSAHRIFLEAEAGTLGAIQLELQQNLLASRPLWGSSLTVGYEFMLRSGFFIRGGVGGTLLWEPSLLSLRDRLGLALMVLHIGYKLW